MLLLMKKIDQIMLKNRGKCNVSSCVPKGSEDKQRASFFFLIWQNLHNTQNLTVSPSVNRQQLK